MCYNIIMKNKREIEYNSKAELISMIVRLWVEVPTQVQRKKLMSFLLTSYRDVDLSTVDALNEMAYDELEEMYNAMNFVLKT